ncbi:hypothetical protein Patl1_25926 [Pistacia atlantica]|uniref:Uncharacterized protein n=1 Tax=Pistacia atlantica TaxID=434234 RepID=A0ACC1B431_9ROSI|nr:hypothetical protein Patl1_25926 [Pistacia atlantica]
MASPSSPKKSSLSKQTSTAGRPPQAVKFARRTSSGRVVSLSRDDDLDMSGEFTPQNDYINYTVLMPPTPDNQPSSGTGQGSDSKPEGSNSYQTSRFGPEARQMSRRVGAGDGGYGDHGGGGNNGNKNGQENVRKYGIGNAFWTPSDKDAYGPDVSMQDFMDKPWKPLTRKVKVPPAILSPYRLLIVFRLVALAFFLQWRIRNPNPDAMWLWGISIVCELWFAFSWILDILPKLNPINRATDLVALRDKFETPSPANPRGRSDLPGVDVFISTADPDKEPPLVTANTLLSILAVDYPTEKLSAYISDDGGAILSFEAMAEAVRFAEVWVPFCRKHNIEPRNPDSYFSQKRDPTKNKKRPDFVKDRRWIKREYDEFKVRINGLPEVIRRRSDAYNSRENMKERNIAREKNGGETTQEPSNVMSKVPEPDPVMGHPDEKRLDFTGVDIRLPMFAYVSREKRKGYDHNKKAGAMNAMVRASAILSNGPFILNLDCDHYIYNCKAIREGMCFMMDRGGDRICYIQFPQRFEGIDPSDRYANHNTVFFDGNMRALDGLQGPVYVGTGTMFRRYALYGFNPPRATEYLGVVGQNKTPAPNVQPRSNEDDSETQPLALASHPDLDLPRRFGNSQLFAESIAVAEYQGRPLADHISVKNGRPPGSLLVPRPPLDAPTVAEAVAVISCWYEDKTEWGQRVGWIYGSVTEDVVTGYRMHNRGWRSVYCITKRDAFRGSAPINLTDRLHQVLRWATGSVEIYFSRNNAIFATRRLKFLQRIAYLNVGIYPFTSFFLVLYCFLPALCLFTGKFIVQNLNTTFLNLPSHNLSNTNTNLPFRSEMGLLKVLAGIEISFKLTTKSAADDDEDMYADLYVVKWTSLFIMPLTIIVVNIVAIVMAFSRTVYSIIPQWSKLLGGTFFSFWVLAHMYPFIKGLLGRRGRVPTIVYVWAGLVSITVSLLWISISPPDNKNSQQNL